MMSIIKWIFFDIGSTLVDESVAYKTELKERFQILMSAMMSFIENGRDFKTQSKWLP